MTTLEQIRSKKKKLFDLASKQSELRLRMDRLKGGHD